jgi:hypothetical protein
MLRRSDGGLIYSQRATNESSIRPKAADAAAIIYRLNPYDWQHPLIEFKPDLAKWSG